MPDGTPNRMGLVNFFGVVAFSPVLLALVIPAIPRLRKSCYRAFQLLHAPVALLVGGGEGMGKLEVRV